LRQTQLPCLVWLGDSSIRFQMPCMPAHLLQLAASDAMRHSPRHQERVIAPFRDWWNVQVNSARVCCSRCLLVLLQLRT
jgi:hypothetical protein